MSAIGAAGFSGTWSVPDLWSTYAYGRMAMDLHVRILVAVGNGMGAWTPETVGIYFLERNLVMWLTDDIFEKQQSYARFQDPCKLSIPAQSLFHTLMRLII